MTTEQKEFHSILLKEGIENRAFFTSNEFHTIWNAVEKYVTQTSQKNELVIPDVVGRSEQFTCNTCGGHEKYWSVKNDDWYCKQCKHICR